jgi:hypothetical protein
MSFVFDLFTGSEVVTEKTTFVASKLASENGFNQYYPVFLYFAVWKNNYLTQ